ncbi:matrixin family metalloprotease [Aeromicrobium sp. Root472D3]|uniref:matrixin family metalloprotease n=1 Tax=Aeromicrobium sp. Root472D3 TaxID=1736540 RepID=UPI000AC6DDDF|nr:matrixin family metalloprotease [Aeromicrobium sp. Root472D3]
MTARGRDADAGRRRAAVAVAALVVLLGALSVASMLDDGAAGGAFPDRPDDAASTPLGVPAARAGDDGQYRLIATQPDGDEPVTYDPCAPIHLVVDPRTIVEGGMRLLDQALDEVSEASGLQFVVDGTTDETAPDDETVRSPDGGWLPVTVTWSDPVASPKLKGSVAGFAGSSSVERDGRRWFVTGTVVLDGPQLARILDGRRGRASVRSVIMHELGHLVGLDHVDAPGQLMQPEGDETLTRWGAGDLAGLAAVGSGACIPY